MNKYEIKLSFNIIGSIVHQQRLLNEIEHCLKNSISLADDGQQATDICSKLDLHLMKNKLTRIYVKQIDIDKGDNGCTSCPVALAINRRLKPRYHVKVYGGSDIYVKDSDSMKYAIGDYFTVSKVIAKNAKVVTDFITSNDDYDKDRKRLKPFSFYIELPLEVLKT